MRHCRWVDEVVQEAPWVIDADFLDKWEIDYVAHDEDPYAASGHDDVYSFVKTQGMHLFQNIFVTKIEPAQPVEITSIYKALYSY